MGPKRAGISSNRFRNFVFTTFMTSEMKRDFLLTLVHTKSNVRPRFIIFQTERCPNTGRFHFQGYCELTDKMTMAGIKTLFKDPTMHVEQRMGSQQEAIAYCSKEETRVAGPFQAGIPCAQGTRSDLEEAKSDIDNGANIMMLWENHFSSMVRYSRSLERYLMLKSVPRTWKTEVIVYWGRAGTGKSRLAFESATHPYVHDGTVWFDGYVGQDDVILDDYTGSIAIGTFLKLCDRYPMQVPVKGGYVNWKPRRLYITSNLQPAEWYPKAQPEQHRAIERRLDSIRFFDAPIDFTSPSAAAAETHGHAAALGVSSDSDGDGSGDSTVQRVNQRRPRRRARVGSDEPPIRGAGDSPTSPDDVGSSGSSGARELL